jgi:FemAB-related protein (PEP-CTERM system-associated)
MNNVSVRIAEETDLPEWQHFVDRRAGAGCMHHAGWHAVLRESYSVTPYFLMAQETRRLVGILPLYYSRSFLTGPHLSSLEDGVFAADPRAVPALLTEARLLRESLGARYLQVRGGSIDRPSEQGFPTVRTFIDTRRPVDALWSAIKKKTRWGVRQAEKTDIRVQHDSALQRLEDFYWVYAEQMRELGTPVIGIDVFRAMRSHLGESRLRLYVVTERQRLIGGMLCILNIDRWSDYFAVVRPSDLTKFANYLLYWHVIRDASVCGVPLLDLGRSTPGSNVQFFKHKWGGREIEVPYRYYWGQEAPTRDVGFETLKRDRGIVQRLWSHLPLTLCNYLGPHIRRQLPFI